MAIKYLLFLFLPFTLLAQTVERIDFEAGGFVLAQLPTKDGKTLYARTDVGGIYKKSGNEDWKFISEFAQTPAALMVQSIDINPFNQEEVIAACGMDYLEGDPGRGLWKTSDGGLSWLQILGPQAGQSSVNFGGNVFRIKIGGPCARYHPTVNGRILAGTLKDKLTGRPEIYLSDDNGNSWKVISTGSSIAGSVSCIQVYPKYPDEIWVGTDEGLWITHDNGNSWSDKIFPGSIDGVYQIMLKIEKSGELTGFVSTGKLYRLDNDASSVKDLTGNFGNYSGYEIIGLSFLDLDESKLMCSMMGYPVKISTDNGVTWGRQLEFNLETKFNPKHTLSTEDKIYTSNIITFQNPADLNTWYSSGGSGPFMTTNGGKSWRYNGEGIDMAVVYDVTFSPNGDIYIPISDWGMARTDEKTYPYIINYSRKYTLDPPPPEKNGDSYMPNVCRSLISIVNPERIYLIGGSVFTYYPAIAVSDHRGEPDSYRILSPSGILAYPNAGPGYDAIFTDGDITTDGTNDILILFMGGGEYSHKIYDASNPKADWYGVYFSSNGGVSFERSQFTGRSEEIYKHSIVSGLFNTNDNVDVDPNDPSVVYLYLEGGNESDVYGGGFFVSNDYGRSFTFKNYVVGNPAIDYRNEGAINIDPSGGGELLIGIKNYGLFSTKNKGVSFEKNPVFKSVSTLDSKGNEIALFGMKEGDEYNKIYLSTDGGSSWEHVYLNGYGVIPSVRKLSLRVDKKGELWISTGGQGLFIYKF